MRKQPSSDEEIVLLANALRMLAADAVERAQSGHPGMPMGMAEVAVVLFHEFLQFDSAHPDWADRDRFVLSAGHGSMLLYGLLYLCGVEGVDEQVLANFRRWGSGSAGHPEYGALSGIETTTGPLGQGLANAVGMAIAERTLNARFSDALVDHRIWSIVGDGCLMEGISHEAAALAGHLRLERLTLLFDDNAISIDGSTALAESSDQAARFRALGWNVTEIDGHQPQQIRAALQATRDSERPNLICCKTQIARGAPTKCGTAAAHGAPLGAEEIVGLRKALDWPHPPFHIPEKILRTWRKAGARGSEAHAAWRARLEKAPERDRFLAALSKDFPAQARTAEKNLATLKAQFLKERTPLASRQSSQKTLQVLQDTFPDILLGGSADLTGSNGTKTPQQRVISAKDFHGNYLHYGVREHAMAAAMNGMALHGGVLPYGGTFLVFSDYCRPALRLSALMGVRVIYVMTHDSIALGEDGPTHQPIEHLASLRAIPGLYVFRPCDSIEVAECWHVALALQAPSVLALSRQALEPLREDAPSPPLASRGGYALKEEGRDSLRLLASGAEVATALKAAKLLDARGIKTSVISMVCWELFEQQSESYKASVLGEGLRFAVEAASSFGWTRYTESAERILGIDRFGASAPGSVVLAKFGFTPDAVAETVHAYVQNVRSQASSSFSKGYAVKGS